MKKIITLMLLSMVSISCQKGSLLQPKKPDTAKTVSFKNIAILGNSITYTPANPSAGWPGSWGMAAKSADSDYVHILTANFQKANPTCKIIVKNIMAFEEDWKNYKLSQLDSIRDLNPDLIILRIGEDVPRPYDKEGFSRAYKALVDFFGPKVVVLGVGSFWPRDKPNDPNNTDEVMSRYASFISLAPLGKDLNNYSYGAWANPGIQQHPNNKGMRAIAETIWAAVQKLEPVN